MSGSPSALLSRLTIDLPIDAPEGTTVETDEVLPATESLNKESASKRADYVKIRVEENAQKLFDVTENLFKLSTERRNLIIHGADVSIDLLSKRQQDAIDMQNGIDSSNGDNDSNCSENDGYAFAESRLGSSIAVKNAVCPIKLPEAKRLPRYTTWIFLDRNQRMTDDQSAVGRRRIYYDQDSGEALICSDSEEELLEDEEEKEFVESQDIMLRSTIQQVGLPDSMLDLFGKCLSRKPSKVKARYEDPVKDINACSSKNENIQGTLNLCLDKDLDAALDSFDNLFCRRCLVFDCRLHGCSQNLIFTAKKQLPWYPPDVDKEPCCPNCYRLAIKKESKAGSTSPQLANHGENPVQPSEIANNAQVPGRKHLSRRSKSSQSESASLHAKNISESSDSEIRLLSDITTVQGSASPSNSKSDSRRGSNKTKCKRITEDILVSTKKRQKKMTAVESESVASESPVSKDLNLHSNSHKDIKDFSSSSQKTQQSHSGRRSSRKDSPVLGRKNSLQVEGFNCQYKEATSESDDTLRKNEFVDENNSKQEIDGDKSWRPLEKALFEKGLEIFGRSSCMIARNLMNGLKDCWEVFQYMNNSENKLSRVGDAVNGMLEGSFKGDGHTITGNQPRRRSRFLRRGGRACRLKSTSKSAGYHALRKRISDWKDQLCRQYNPCNCLAPCGKECSCIVNGTCCEKYCGCPKSCKNRFRGCLCAKGQCRSRQCPCFAADRECDPDVCRNCWISCGDGTLGIPSQRGDNYECMNMKLLLKQHQRILLGRSDVSGWGAFLKNSVEKHEYLGEYTGEIISHHEADKRGKIYDRENSSFLFNLNDQFVIDAYGKGDKLKFANHSPDPNCYAKVIMTAGDHRVGIFAKERICAGKELFYDYHYTPETAPAWARKPEASTTRKRLEGFVWLQLQKWLWFCYKGTESFIVQELSAVVSMSPSDSMTR
ncbi:histone-lysine N-methyltransferase CLF-like isoform X2 [Lycium barbarum]|uniref:histone-lysine N-methyltransferase CLF-like isoform X2 n=1 Tax=Lycium barbarum TaxID=112863 RepID=UPI00293EFFAF|nr:histone-lysine N-methyltransferase CLF-like isoform X2 [Lycium barbarum]